MLARLTKVLAAAALAGALALTSLSSASPAARAGSVRSSLPTCKAHVTGGSNWVSSYIHLDSCAVDYVRAVDYGAIALAARNGSTVVKGGEVAAYAALLLVDGLVIVKYSDIICHHNGVSINWLNYNPISAFNYVPVVWYAC